MKLDKINLVYIKYKLFLDKVKSIIKESKSPEEAISLLNDNPNCLTSPSVLTLGPEGNLFMSENLPIELDILFVLLI